MESLKEYKLKNLKLRNKIVLPPMCMYSADNNGFVNDFHKSHYTSRALGGAGLIILEATAISENGRITDKDLGIWTNEQIPGLKSLAKLIKEEGAAAGIQLAHAGRKCLAEVEDIVAPSPIPYDSSYKLPKVLSKLEIQNIVKDFQKAAIRADEAGFDLIEIHAAHGYLIHEFLSPLSNKREDAYGGSLENRTRFLREVLAAVHKVWPRDKTISLRVSADDYMEGGINQDEIVRIINQIKVFIDIVHVSSGGLVDAKIELYPGYQVKYSKFIKDKCDIPTIAVGLIEDLDSAEEVLRDRNASLIAMGRKLLREPNYILNYAYKNKYNFSFPRQYERAYRYRSYEVLKEI